MPHHLLQQFAAAPKNFRAALIVGVAFMVFLTLDQMHWWQTRPDYAFGWLAPVFALYLIMDRWPRLQALWSEDAPGAASSRAIDLLATAVLGLGTLCFLLGAVSRAGGGTTQPGSLALAVGFAGIFLAMIYLNGPKGATASSRARTGLDALARNRQLQTVGLFIFPALIWILSAPLASAVENAVSLFLLTKVVAVVFAIFNTLGYPLIQEGNVLVLPLGQVGVVDACSGIRSLTGCLFAGSFLAAVFLASWWKKVLLIGAALLLAFLTNLLRSLFLTSWAYAYGSAAIEGSIHDVTGYAVLGLTVLGLFALLPLFDGGNWRRWLGVMPPGSGAHSGT